MQGHPQNFNLDYLLLKRPTTWKVFFILLRYLHTTQIEFMILSKNQLN